MNKNLNNSENQNVRKTSMYAFVLIILLFQLSIAFVLHVNDNSIQEYGKVFRIKVDSVVVDYTQNKATVDFHVKQSENLQMSTIDGQKQKINEMSGFYYNVVKDEYSKSILVETDLSKRRETEYLQVTTGIKNSFARPSFYIKGDKLKPINTGSHKEIGYITIEADVIVYKGAYIVKEIYINRTPYNEFIEDNYFDILDIEGL